MILEIEIKNFAILNQLRLQLGSGLNVITGETGAGKSLFLRALQFLLGGAPLEEGEVQAVFHPSSQAQRRLREDGFEIEDELYVSRECKSGSRTLTRINGTLVPAGKIKALSPWLIEIHGQHSHHALLESKTPLALLDSFGSKKVLDKKDEVSLHYEEWRQLQKRKKELEEKTGQRERQMDLCRYEVREIHDAKLTAHEEEALRDEKEKLTRVDRLQSTLAETLALTEQTDLLQIEKRLEALSPFDKKLEPWVAKVRDLSYEWMEFRETLKASRGTFTANPGRLEQVIERLDLLHRLQKKYGKTVSEILEYAKERETELKALELLEENLAEIDKKIETCEKILQTACEELSTMRSKNAEKLNALMGKELETLAIPKAKFNVSLETLETWSASGTDRAEFLVSLNPGEALLPLAKVASGGELSRIMLALRAGILTDPDPTLILDEVDTGLGGQVAFHVAERIRKLAEGRQVLCVTHLHQVAAVADHHFTLEKCVAHGKTTVTAKELTQDEKILELARMMAGKRAGEAAVQHAEELLKRGDKI